MPGGGLLPKGGAQGKNLGTNPNVRVGKLRHRWFWGAARLWGGWEDLGGEDGVASTIVLEGSASGEATLGEDLLQLLISLYQRAGTCMGPINPDQSPLGSRSIGGAGGAPRSCQASAAPLTPIQDPPLHPSHPTQTAGTRGTGQHPTGHPKRPLLLPWLSQGNILGFGEGDASLGHPREHTCVSGCPHPGEAPEGPSITAGLVRGPGLIRGPGTRWGGQERGRSSAVAPLLIAP